MLGLNQGPDFGKLPKLPILSLFNYPFTHLKATEYPTCMEGYLDNFDLFPSFHEDDMPRVSPSTLLPSSITPTQILPACLNNKKKIEK